MFASGSNLTILFQGKFDKNSLISIKKTMSAIPFEKVVVSCWLGDTDDINIAELEGIDFIFSKDPGAEKINGFKLDNINRQIVSTFNGLEKVNTKFVLKIRTDAFLTNDSILNLSHLYQKKAQNSSQLFNSKVTVTNITTLEPIKSQQCFHICDWLYYGETEDVKRIFALALKGKDYFSYFSSVKDIDDGICSKHRAESALISHLVVEPENSNSFTSAYEFDEGLIPISLDVLKNDFIVLNPWTLGLGSVKHKKIYFWLDKNRYFESDWLNANNVEYSSVTRLKELFYLSCNYSWRSLSLLKRLCLGTKKVF